MDIGCLMCGCLIGAFGAIIGIALYYIINNNNKPPTCMA